MNYAHKSLLAAACLFISSPAFGQATRTWVSGVGDDVNPCSRTAPCKTFAGALSKTATGGEINALDPSGYGAVTINKSLVIDGLGPMASILTGGATGVTVNSAGAVVIIRNITINCAGNTLGNGIRIVAAAAVSIENVVIENCAGTGTNGRGIAIETSADVRVDIRNVTFTNNTSFGVHSNPSAGTVTLSVDGSAFYRGGTTAIQLRQNTNATVNDTVVTGHNPGAAVAAELSTINTHISNSVFTDNAFGVFSGNGGSPTTRISHTVITRSAVAALQVSGGTIISYGNNAIRGNAGNEVPSVVEGPR